jgi:hypothetical protein
MDYKLIDELPKETQLSVRTELMRQSKLNKKSFKDVWIGSGWLTLTKNNQLIFKGVK